MSLMKKISLVDRFDAAWSQIEKREGQTLKQLKLIATVSSVGASTRIEGSKMSDEEVRVLIENLKISKLEERDEQEVAGYFKTLDTISESYRDIEISEVNIKNLHKILMSYSEKDEWHRGNYKQLSNSIEADHPNGTKQIIFRTTEPGIATEEIMRKLIEWYHTDKDTIPIVRAALFVYEFLSIHPFQDGNGRLSRLLGTLLLLREGYSWIQFVSFEHEIENRKPEYYEVLMQTQRMRPNENVDEWVGFFMRCLLHIQDQLMKKLETKASTTNQLAPREKNILTFIENHPGSKSSEIAEKLNIPLSTVKKMLTSMTENKLVLKYGIGAGTNYLVEKVSPLKTDIMFKLTNSERKKEFLLTNPSSFIEVKKIILIPLFKWVVPDEWSAKLINQGLYIKITGYTNQGGSFSHLYNLSAFNDSMYFHPKFTLHNPINIPNSVSEYAVKLNEYPLRIDVELFGSVSVFEFDVSFVYDKV